ncbi:hypothetical protein PaecuDRAFT_4082 [Paenibacillus curdlanolyticus YK9]|uniref:Uncharacterized protein n=1 Tax=Paenibacillus curdlanolyticus YK9 TaxID=717606 RepID=E0IEJ1_9BACL|nr:hypothetical protein PaecuDRAFT_4082 [Paenibacillus curdlanolyticus YK9]
MTTFLFLFALGFCIVAFSWFEWPSLPDLRTKTTFATIIFLTYGLTVAITLKPELPGPFQLYEHLLAPLVSDWMKS